jgi:hypothetical protein
MALEHLLEPSLVQIKMLRQHAGVGKLLVEHGKKNLRTSSVPG